MTMKLSNDYAVPNRGPSETYPFSTMTSGQSFFLAGERATRRLCAAVYARGLKGFTVRTVTENGVLGARCFRR